MKMTVELFDSIINTSQDCVFWKDSERRFLGVNQAFLDFYGFESADILIGKTDEDMGWHSDPEPFKQDEMRVLAGRSTYKVQGKCVIRGEERDIIASKRPLYDGDNIVGLVGSFVDITDVLRRREGLDSAQVVYTIEKLRKFAFFDRIVDEISLDEILDTLTGVISRSYSMKFVNNLISERIPFTFTIIDLDNFKHINDSYGHTSGDHVLKYVSRGIAEAVGERGLVGRFGGDELLLIDLENIEADQKESFFEMLYTKSGALRTTIDFGTGSSLITATSGSASFPADTDNFDELFGIIDKMLYIGKGRGRDCYTIYDERTHKNLEFVRITQKGMFREMQNMRTRVSKEKSLRDKLTAVAPGLKDVLQIEDLYYIDESGRMKSVMDPSFDSDAGDISNLMHEEVFADRTLERVEKDSPVFYRALKDNGLESALIMRFGDGADRGYLVCAVDRKFRIWQDNECAILYFLAELLNGE